MGLCGIMMSTQSGSAKTTPYKARREDSNPKSWKEKTPKMESQHQRDKYKRVGTKEKSTKKVDLGSVIQKWWICHGTLETLKVSFLTSKAKWRNTEIVIYQKDKLEDLEEEL